MKTYRNNTGQRATLLLPDDKTQFLSAGGQVKIKEKDMTAQINTLIDQRKLVEVASPPKESKDSN